MTTPLAWLVAPEGLSGSLRSGRALARVEISGQGR
jgi:hypothetical protein